jgi:hypothetical protein
MLRVFVTSISCSILRSILRFILLFFFRLSAIAWLAVQVNCFTDLTGCLMAGLVSQSSLSET